MVKFAILGSDSSHTEMFTQAAHGGAVGRRRDCEIASIWGNDYDEASRKARALGIERVARTTEEALEGVDAALVLGRFADEHFGPARLAIEQGLPTFVDKLLTDQPATARQLLDLAQAQGSALASFSPYRYSPSLRGFGRKITDGLPEQGILVCFGPLDCRDLQGDPRFLNPFFYGIHSLEIVFTLLGDDIVAVRYLTTDARVSALIEFAGGAGCSLHMVRELDGEDYRLQWLTRRASIGFDILKSDSQLYTAAFEGICVELLDEQGTRSAERNLKAIEILQTITCKAPE